MQEDLNRIANFALFARVVQTGGISRCAKYLGVERTTVSRRLAELERQLGVKLLVRSSRNTVVTDAGRLCFEQCEQLLDVARQAEAIATEGKVSTEARPVAVGAPPDIIEHYLTPRAAEFEAKNPDTRIQCLPVSATAADGLESADFVLGWEGRQRPEMMVRKIATIEQALYASPAYLKNHGRPRQPVEVREHYCIVDANSSEVLYWRFAGELESSRIRVRDPMSVGSLLDVRASVLAALGLGLLPRYLCQDYVQSNRLIELLPEYRAERRALFLTTPRYGASKPGATGFRLFLERSFESLAP